MWSSWWWCLLQPGVCVAMLSVQPCLPCIVWSFLWLTCRGRLIIKCILNVLCNWWLKKDLTIPINCSVTALQFVYHAWITDSKTALKERSKEKRRFWKKYARGRHKKSKKDGNSLLKRCTFSGLATVFVHIRILSTVNQSLSWPSASVYICSCMLLAEFVLAKLVTHFLSCRSRDYWGGWLRAVRERGGGGEVYRSAVWEWSWGKSFLFSFDLFIYLCIYWAPLTESSVSGHFA